MKEAESIVRKDPGKAGEIAEHIINRIEVSKHPQLIFDALLVKAASRLVLNKNNEALEYLKKCEELKSSFPEIEVGGSYYQYWGTVYSKLSDYGKALENYHKFLSISKKEDKDINIGIAYNNIGLVYIYLGNYEKALTNLYETRKIMEKLGKKHFEAIVLNNIGICHSELKSYNLSLEYYMESLKIKEELKDKEGIGNALNNIGQSYFHLNDLSKSLEYTKKAERIAIEINNRKRMATTFTNMGRIYMAKGKTERAENYLLNSVKLKKELNDKWELAFTMKILAELYMNMGNNNRAIIQAESSLKLSEEINSTKLTGDILLLISGIHKNMKDYVKALESYSKYTETKEKLINEKSRDKIEELKISYEIEKMNSRIKLLEKENDLKNRDILSQKKIQKLFILLSVLLFLIMVLVYFAYKTKSGSNKKLLLLNSSLEEGTVKLEKALLEVKTLTGLLPVCSSCKKVRDKENNWNPMEEYIKEYSEASITHSICPDCKGKVFTEKETE